MITTATLVRNKSEADIAREWDAIASLRARQISSGEDLSFHFVLKPVVFKLLSDCNCSRLLDVGCGTGELTQNLAKRSNTAVGIDISSESIRLAKNASHSFDNLQYVVQSVQGYARFKSGQRFTVAVANMVLTTVTDMTSFFRALAELLMLNGQVVFTVPHPCFWPRYWEYEDAEWFDYETELFVEAPFRISRQQFSEFTTTHIHRPLEAYVREITNAGFVLEALVEPVPSIEVQERYPAPWRFPRFLAGRCRSNRSVDSH